MRLLLATALIALLPSFGLAQSIVRAPSVQPVGSESRQSLVDELLHLRIDGLGSPSTIQGTPLWSTPDGHILAMIALTSDDTPSLTKSPQWAAASDWQLVDVTNFFNGGLLLSLGKNTTTHVNLSQSAVLGPAYLAAGCSGDARFANAACANRTTLANAGTLRVGTDWTLLDNFDVDLDYGLSWLHHNSLASVAGAPLARDSFAGVGSSEFTSLLIPGLESANLQNSSINALGHWRLNDLQTLDLGASLGHVQLYTGNDTPLTSLNQAALSVGLHYGAFSGAVVGHVLGPADPVNGNQRWSGLDIGVSWRTPWQGQLSIGAQNLWSSGAVAPLADPAAHDADSLQARVPYVRYHQDL